MERRRLAASMGDRTDVGPDIETELRTTHESFSE
jgi:hypothetical protein